MSKNQKHKDKHQSIQPRPEQAAEAKITPAVYKGDKIFNRVLLGVSATVFIVLLGIFITLLSSATPSFEEFGLRFFTIDKWFARMTSVSGLSGVQTANNPLRMEVKFISIIDGASVTSEKFHLFTADNSSVPVTAKWFSSEFSNKVEVIVQNDLMPGVTNTLVVLKNILDYNHFPLADIYRCRFVLLQTNINGFDYNIVKTVSISGERYGDIESYITEGDQRWFGALPFVSGTLLTSLLALLISLPFSLAIAVFLGEYFTSGIVSDVLKTTNELLAGIPSIIYGFWAFKFVAPLVYELFPYSDGGGSNILTASIVLAIMIIPYSASLSREVINMVPNDLKEAAYAMGATRYEVVKRVIVPYSSSGIVAGTLLAFGRALGETMAVTLVIGNKNEIPQSIFSSGQTIASLIASKYAEGGRMQIAALTELGLILFVITLVFGLLGRYLIKKLSVR